MPSSSASVSTGSTGNPSVWVTVILCPPSATRNAVSPPALTSRSRNRLPGRARKKLYQRHEELSDLYPVDWPVSPKLPSDEDEDEDGEPDDH